MKLTKENLIFTWDKEMKISYLNIRVNDVIAVNKRQINRFDVNKISIFYKNNAKSNKFQELKIKVASRRETDLWIQRLRNMINPTRYEFIMDHKSIINSVKVSEYFSPYKTYIKDPKHFYMTLKALEYIFLKKYKNTFFEKLELNKIGNVEQENYFATYSSNEFIYNENTFTLVNSNQNIQLVSHITQIDEEEKFVLRNAEEIYKIKDEENELINRNNENGIINIEDDLLSNKSYDKIEDEGFILKNEIDDKTISKTR